MKKHLKNSRSFGQKAVLASACAALATDPTMKADTLVIQTGGTLTQVPTNSMKGFGFTLPLSTNDTSWTFTLRGHLNPPYTNGVFNEINSYPNGAAVLTGTHFFDIGTSTLCFSNSYGNASVVFTNPVVTLLRSVDPSTGTQDQMGVDSGWANACVQWGDIPWYPLMEGSIDFGDATVPSTLKGLNNSTGGGIVIQDPTWQIPGGGGPQILGNTSSRFAAIVPDATNGVALQTFNGKLLVSYPAGTTLRRSTDLVNWTNDTTPSPVIVSMPGKQQEFFSVR